MREKARICSRFPDFFASAEIGVPLYVLGPGFQCGLECNCIDLMRQITGFSKALIWHLKTHGYAGHQKVRPLLLETTKKSNAPYVSPS